MEPEDSAEANDTRNDADARLDALRRLAHAAQTPATELPTKASRAQPAPHRRWIFGLSATLIALIVASVITAVLLNVRPTQTTHINKPLQPIAFAPISDNINCFSDMAWSSNLQMIAVLGYSAGCPTAEPPYDTGYLPAAPYIYEGPTPQNGNSEGVVAIYDAQHGVSHSYFTPDSVVYQAILSQEPITPAYTAWLAQVGLRPPGNWAINYTHILWASGNQRVIVAFNFYLPDSAPIGDVLPGHILQGLLITDLEGHQPQVLLSMGGQQAAGAVIWDLQANKAVATETANPPFATLEPALSYSWSAQDAVTPGAPLTPDALPSASLSGAVGAPLAGAASFTLWQPGGITTALPGTQAAPRNLANTVTFAPDTAAFSPDGRYLMTSIGVAGLVRAAQGATDPRITSATLAPYGWQSAPQIPLRDAGFKAAIALIQANDQQSTGVDGYVAWRPDGRVIAVSSLATDGAARLFDTTTGKQIGLLKAPQLSNNPPPPNVGALAWSPDGSHLAYFDGFELSLWYGALLPR